MTPLAEIDVEPRELSAWELWLLVLSCMVTFFTLGFWLGQATAQTFTHPNLTAIDLQVMTIFANIKTTQASIVAGQVEVKDVDGKVTDSGWPKGTYQQGLATPAIAPDGKVPVAFDYTRTPSDHSATRDWNDLITGVKPVEMSRVQYSVDVYYGPYTLLIEGKEERREGAGYTMMARLVIPASDPLCLAIRPAGPDCAWSYFEHIGPQTYRDTGELTWTLDAVR